MMTANLAVILAQLGYRVGLVDLDLQSPTMQEVLGCPATLAGYTLHDYLFAQCQIGEIATPVYPATMLPLPAFGATDTGSMAGAAPSLEQTRMERVSPERAPLFVVSGSAELDDITELLRAGYDPQRLIDGFSELQHTLNLDYLLIDTHPGLGEEALLAIAICDVVLMVLLPDAQSIQQGAVSLEIARKLGVNCIFPVLNLVPDTIDPSSLQTRIRELYDIAHSAWVPFAEDVALFGQPTVSGQAQPPSLLRDFLDAIAQYLVKLAEQSTSRELVSNGATPAIDTHTHHVGTMQSQPPGLKLSDLVSLPVLQQRLLSWMMRRQHVTLAEMDAQLHDPNVNLSALVQELLAKNYIQATHDTPPRYHIHFAPKTHRTGTTDLWRVLDNDTNTS